MPLNRAPPLRRPRLTHTLVTRGWSLLASLFLGWALLHQAQAATPRVLDPRWELFLAAEQPFLVTPTGLAVESTGRILIVESHTHFPPPGYQGPTSDRLRAAWDADGDGHCERIETVFSGTKHTMNVAVDSAGRVFLATRAMIQCLGPMDAQGCFTAAAMVARLETPGDYPHNGLSGFAFDGSGWVYFGMGENLGAPYRLIGADGTTLTGGGEGGNIFRCRADGSKLEPVATGFWNPFHLACDTLGRLFAVDNDPDSRPPCRLLHIVRGGDYGYRYRNGRRGTHPFTSWNGELPGTLPMVAGTGEAPSGVLACESSALPDDYRDSLLVTSWGDHRIDQFRLQPAGASWTAKRTPLVIGDEYFRPVGIAAAPNGWLYITDWVDKAYEVHGRGRLWCLRPKSTATPLATAPIRARDDASRTRLQRYRQECGAPGAVQNLAAGIETFTREPDPGLRAWLAENWPGLADVLGDRLFEEPLPVQAAALRSWTARHDPATLVPLLRSPDPFVQQAARLAMRRWATAEELTAMARSADAELRLQAILVIRQRDPRAGTELLKELLRDADSRVRCAAIQWVAETHYEALRVQITDGLRQPGLPRQLIEAHLAALEMLDGVVRAPGDEWTGAQYALRLLMASACPSELRGDLLRIVPPHHEELSHDRLWSWAHDADRRLAIEAVRSLIARADPQLQADLASLVQDSSLDENVRLAALGGLDPRDPLARPVVEQLLTQPGPWQTEALGVWRDVVPDRTARELLERLATRQPHLATQVAVRLRDPATSPPPAWTIDRVLALPGGDPAAGERLFFHPRGPNCLRCHEVAGRGAAIGPSLSTAITSLTRQRLVESLLNPSREVAPQFTLWSLHLIDGTVREGLRIGVEADGAERYVDPQGGVFSVATEQIEFRRPTQRSLMPDGILNALTVEEVADLLAYLATLPQRP